MDLEEENDSIENEELSIKTRVFSDCFRNYQITDFNNLGLILKRVNQGVWFGIGDIHINTIESLQHQIKSITKNFTGLSIELLKKIFNNNEQGIKNYLDSYLCFALFIREIRIKKLNRAGRINLLCDYLLFK